LLCVAWVNFGPKRAWVSSIRQRPNSCDTQERSVDDARQRVVASYKFRANEAFKIAFGVFNVNGIHIAIHVFRGLLLQNVFNVFNV
jgi:hypothetical protein